LRFNGGVAHPSGLENALAETSDLVTLFLERLVGEPIDAHVQSQFATGADRSNGLGVDEGDRVLVRAAVLSGRRSGHAYVYAESTIVLGRVPERFRARIETGEDPIGRILAEEGIPVTREALTGSAGAHRLVPSEAPVSPGDHLLHRTYRIDIDGSPAMVIAEWFLNSLEGFLRHDDR
jgi:chorismate-pyruvate lyase